MRHYATPLVLTENPADALALKPLSLDGLGEDSVDEAYIRDLVYHHPAVLPIAEIDSQFLDAVSICTELNTRGAGSLDNFLVTPTGLPILVECKLWRNPEGRRKVVAQILDYARALSRFSCSDIQREVSTRLRSDTALFDRVRARAPDTDEIEFNDALTQNLRKGRFLLLIVGDGIREGVEAIGEILQGYAGLPFTLGLVELPIFVAADGTRLVTPRVIARTTTISHTVIAVPEGFQVASPEENEPGGAELDEATEDRRSFWREFLGELKLDDPEQPIPQVSPKGYVVFKMPAPSGSSWMTTFRNVKDGRVGLFLSYYRNSVGERASDMVLNDWDTLRIELGPRATIRDDNGHRFLEESIYIGPFEQAGNRERAISWLRERTNAFVNALRPRIRAAVADLQQEIG